MGVFSEKQEETVPEPLEFNVPNLSYILFLNYSQTKLVCSKPGGFYRKDEEENNSDSNRCYEKMTTELFRNS